jgi:hypothetical protein
MNQSSKEEDVAVDDGLLFLRRDQNSICKKRERQDPSLPSFHDHFTLSLVMKEIAVLLIHILS